ncbi:MAG: YciI family protein [Vicinamibacteria bacterium]|nr:YciI family protein [Vicinamibacteria bacterium]
MRAAFLVLCLCAAPPALAQEAKPSPAPYDADLAQRLGADQRGMKSYVLVLLKTGPKADLPKGESDRLFAGHMANIGRLAADGKLVVAGPMVKNDRHYEGVFVFNVKTVKDAEALLATDPAVAAGALAFEAYGWYASAALMEVVPIHARIDKTGR